MTLASSLTWVLHLGFIFTTTGNGFLRPFMLCSDSSHVTCCVASLRSSLKPFRKNPGPFTLAPFLTAKPLSHRKLPHLAAWLGQTLDPVNHNCRSFFVPLLSRSRKLCPFCSQAGGWLGEVHGTLLCSSAE